MIFVLKCGSSVVEKISIQRKHTILILIFVSHSNTVCTCLAESIPIHDMPCFSLCNLNVKMRFSNLYKKFNEILTGTIRYTPLVSFSDRQRFAASISLNNPENKKKNL